MDRYEKIKKLIQNAQDADLLSFGNTGVTQSWIERAESRLGFQLPESYKWWLQTYGSGVIGVDEIYTIFQKDWDTVSGLDVIHQYEINTKLDSNRSNQLEFFSPGVSFYFDTSKSTENHEYPVYYSPGNIFYSEDFLQFLEKQISQNEFIL